MDIVVVFSKIFVLFLLIAVGFIAGKLGIMDAEMNSKLSRLILTISLPAYVISAVLNAEHATSARQILMMFLITFLFYALVTAFSWFIPFLLGAPKTERGMYRFMGIFSNSGFMGFPITQSILGNTALLYASVYNVPCALMVFTLGLYLVVGNDSEVKMDYHLFLTPGVVAAVLSMIIYLCNISFPAVVEETLSLTGQIMVPGSMMVLGASLAGLPLKGVFGDWRVYVFCLIRLIAIPYLTWLVFGLFVHDRLILGVIVLLAAMPVANNATLFSARYHKSLDLASKGVFISTMLSLFTIPLMVYLLLL
ncbi:MAG: AEC family transporter [Firmicutes bacterium]|nr:AEC family transporter [Bacillota bacterium]